MTIFRSPGTPVTCEYRALGKTFMSVPGIVVTDDNELVAFYLPIGNTSERLVQTDGSPIPRVVTADALSRLDTRMERSIRTGPPSLIVTRPERRHAVHIHWSLPAWIPSRWYVNLQEPLMRTSQGFATTDQFLDIVVDARLSWRWKDEDELEEAVAVGRLSAAEAESVRAEGERVVADIEARRWPFDGAYDDWRPDPSWEIPCLPDDWGSEQ